MDDAVWDPQEEESFTTRYLRQIQWGMKVVRLDLEQKARYLRTHEADEDAPLHYLLNCGENLQRETIRGLITLARDYVQNQWMRHTWVDDVAQVNMDAEEYCDYVIKQLAARIGGGSN